MTRCTLNCIRGFHTRLWFFFHFLKTISKSVRPKNQALFDLNLAERRKGDGLVSSSNLTTYFLNLRSFLGPFAWFSSIFIRPEKLIKWTPFTTSVTCRTVECIRVFDARFFPLSICSSSSNCVNKDLSLT
jgi:hypothetical protein